MNLELTPEEAAELNKEFPQQEGELEIKTEETPETTETPQPPAGIATEDILKALEEMGSKIEELKKPEVPPSETPKEEIWAPKDWNDVLAKTQEAATQAIKDQQAAVEKQIADAAQAEKTAIDEITNRVDDLEKKGRIPKIGDKESDTDPGVAARKEMFALASQYNTMDFSPILDMIEVAHKANQYFDYKTFKWTEKVVNPGKNAPVGSSSTTTPAPRALPDYKMIKGHSLEELARMGITE